MVLYHTDLRPSTRSSVFSFFLVAFWCNGRSSKDDPLLVYYTSISLEMELIDAVRVLAFGPTLS